MGLDEADVVLMTTSALKANGKEKKPTLTQHISIYCANFQRSQMVIYSPAAFYESNIPLDCRSRDCPASQDIPLQK
jgi:hypothetical protein